MKALLILSLLLATVSAQNNGEYTFPGMRPPGLRPPRVYMIGGQLGFYGRPLPHIRWGGAMTAPPEVRRVRGRIFSPV